MSVQVRRFFRVSPEFRHLDEVTCAAACGVNLEDSPGLARAIHAYMYGVYSVFFAGTFLNIRSHTFLANPRSTTNTKFVSVTIVCSGKGIMAPSWCSILISVLLLLTDEVQQARVAPPGVTLFLSPPMAPRRLVALHRVRSSTAENFPWLLLIPFWDFHCSFLFFFCEEVLLLYGPWGKSAWRHQGCKLRSFFHP